MLVYLTHNVKITAISHDWNGTCRGLRRSGARRGFVCKFLVCLSPTWQGFDETRHPPKRNQTRQVVRLSSNSAASDVMVHRASKYRKQEATYLNARTEQSTNARIML